MNDVFNFSLTEKQKQKIKNWISELPELVSIANWYDRVSYTFIPSSIGCRIVVKDIFTENEIDVTEYNDW